MKTKINSVYEKRDTVIDAIDPVVKYIGVLTLGIGTMAFPAFWYGYVMLILLTAAAFLAGLGKIFLVFLSKFAVPILIMLVIIQGIFSPRNQTVLLDLGFTQLYVEGTLIAVKIVGALLVFIGAFWLTSKTTDTGRMVAAFERVGLTGYMGYLILATLSVIPQMQKRMDVIRNAQNARGLETEGSLYTRIKAFLPLIGPVIMSSLIDVQERGMTLELRGFTVKGIRKTRLTQAVETVSDKRLKIGLLVYFAVIIILAVVIRFIGDGYLWVI